MKTLLVGLDAACWPYLDPLLKEGQMPTFQRLMDAGAWGTLHSTMPPWTPTAWATLATGKNPGRHGVFDMMWRRPGSYEFGPTSGSVRSGTPFWKRLNACGIRVGLVNIPFTYPAEAIDGFVVCGFGTPDGAPDFVQPAELSSSPLFAGYRPAVPAKFLRSASPEDVLEKEKEHQSRQVQIAAELAQRYQVDVLAINLMLTDHANHKMPEMALVREAYRHADADLDTLLRAFAPDNVLLISDHGSSRVRGDFLLNAWLQDQGYFIPAQRPQAEQTQVLNWILRQYLKGVHGWDGSLERAARLLLRYGMTHLPDAVQKRFWARLEAVLPRAQDYVRYANEPARGQTTLFPGSSYSGLLYLNVAGREEGGIVPAPKREALLDELAGRLSQIVEPDSGRTLFSNIYRPEQVYHGPATAFAPDLILDAYDMPWNIRTRNSKPVVSQLRDGYFVLAAHGRDYGWHSKEGVFVFASSRATTGAFKAGPQDLELQLVDVPALLLHLYDVPIPADYDGRVATDLLRPTVAGRPVRSQAGDSPELALPQGTNFSAEEAGELINHLQALGYLE